MTYYYHDVPGRLRIKSPKLKGDHPQCRMAKGYLEKHEGIQAVSVNPVTGSVVVTYDPKRTSAKAIMELLSREGYFHHEQAVTSERYINNSAEKMGQLVGRIVLAAFVEKVFEGFALSLISLLL
jgi:copper chaperone CopZ